MCPATTKVTIILFRRRIRDHQDTGHQHYEPSTTWHQWHVLRARREGPHPSVPRVQGRRVAQKANVGRGVPIGRETDRDDKIDWS